MAGSQKDSKTKVPVIIYRCGEYELVIKHYPRCVRIQSNGGTPVCYSFDRFHHTHPGFTNPYYLPLLLKKVQEGELPHKIEWRKRETSNK